MINAVFVYSHPFSGPPAIPMTLKMSSVSSDLVVSNCDEFR